MTGQTIRLPRVLRGTPDRLYRAFTDPDAMVKWLPPFGFTATMHESDVREGGGYRMSFTNFTTGASHTFGGTEVHIVQEGVPDVIPAEMCYQGWQESLIQLAQLVDPEIPDEG